MSGEKWQRFNQLLSKAGLPAAVMDDEAEALSERIADSQCTNDEALERNSSPFGRAWAAKAFEQALKDWDHLGEMPGVEIPEDTSRLASEPDSSTWWVLVQGDRSRERVAVEHLSQYREVTQQRIAHIHFCQAGISVKCEGTIGKAAAANGLVESEASMDSLCRLMDQDDHPRWLHDYAGICRKLIAMPNAIEPFDVVYFGIKRGTYILTAKMCSVCRDWLRNCGPLEDINKDVQYSLGTAETGCTLGGEQPDLARGWYYTLDSARNLLKLPYPETAIRRDWKPPWPHSEGV